MLKKLKLLILASVLVLPLILSPIRASAATTVAITSPTSGEEVTGTSFTVTGTATADRLITVSVNGDEVGTTTSDGSGDWSLEVTGQDAGAKTIEAVASTQYAYVLNGDAATMSVINTVTDEVVNTVTTTSNQPGNITISPDGTQAVSTSGYGGDGSIRVYSLADPEAPVITNNITAADSYAMNAFYSPDGTYFYVNSVQNDVSSSTVTRYTSASPGTSAAVTGYNQRFPVAIGFNSSGSTMYVSNLVGNGVSSTLSVVNTATNTQSSVIDTGAITHAGGIIMVDDSEMYMVSNSLDVAFPVTDLTGTPTVGADIAVGDGPQGAVLNDDKSRLIVVNGTDNSLSVINTSSNAVVDTISTGASTTPVNLFYTSDFSKLYLTQYGTDNVRSLNPTSFATLPSPITVGDGPRGIAIAPVESATTSVDFTLSAASSSSADETLADTGQNSYLYLALVSGLVIIPALYIRKRLFNR